MINRTFQRPMNILYLKVFIEMLRAIKIKSPKKGPLILQKKLIQVMKKIVLFVDEYNYWIKGNQ